MNRNLHPMDTSTDNAQGGIANPPPALQKKTWQAPVLKKLDMRETQNGGNGATDGLGYS